MKTITIPIPFRSLCWDADAMLYYTDAADLLERLEKVVTLVQSGKVCEAALFDKLTVEDVRTALTDGADWPVEAAESIAQFIVTDYPDCRGCDVHALAESLESALARISDAEALARHEANDRKALEDFADKLRAIKLPVLKTQRGQAILAQVLDRGDQEPVSTLEECAALSLDISNAAATLPDYI